VRILAWVRRSGKVILHALARPAPGTSRSRDVHMSIRDQNVPSPAGSRLHGAGEEGVRFRDIAEVIGRQLKRPVVSVAAEEAGDHFGWLPAFASIDNPTSSALTQERLGWRPGGPPLIADMGRPERSSPPGGSAGWINRRHAPPWSHTNRCRS
jgi:hypothetical protein